MHLIQILLPLRDDQGQPFPRHWYDALRGDLTERFGGATAYLQAPAEGLWKDDKGDVDRDEVVILEVMADAVDRAWWQACREGLERRFRQDEVVIRALGMERL